MTDKALNKGYGLDFRKFAEELFLSNKFPPFFLNKGFAWFTGLFSFALIGLIFSLAGSLVAFLDSEILAYLSVAIFTSIVIFFGFGVTILSLILRFGVSSVYSRLSNLSIVQQRVLRRRYLQAFALLAQASAKSRSKVKDAELPASDDLSSTKFFMSMGFIAMVFIVVVIIVQLLSQFMTGVVALVFGLYLGLIFFGIPFMLFHFSQKLKISIKETLLLRRTAYVLVPTLVLGLLLLSYGGFNLAKSFGLVTGELNLFNASFGGLVSETPVPDTKEVDGGTFTKGDLDSQYPLVVGADLSSDLEAVRQQLSMVGYFVYQENARLREIKSMLSIPDPDNKSVRVRWQDFVYGVDSENLGAEAVLSRIKEWRTTGYSTDSGFAPVSFDRQVQLLETAGVDPVVLTAASKLAVMYEVMAARNLEIARNLIPSGDVLVGRSLAHQYVLEADTYLVELNKSEEALFLLMNVHYGYPDFVDYDFQPLGYDFVDVVETAFTQKSVTANITATPDPNRKVIPTLMPTSTPMPTMTATPTELPPSPTPEPTYTYIPLPTLDPRFIPGSILYGMPTQDPNPTPIAYATEIIQVQATQGITDPYALCPMEGFTRLLYPADWFYPNKWSSWYEVAVAPGFGEFDSFAYYNCGNGGYALSYSSGGGVVPWTIIYQVPPVFVDTPNHKVTPANFYQIDLRVALGISDD